MTRPFSEDKRIELRKKELREMRTAQKERVDQRGLVFASEREGLLYRCPCCYYKTLENRGGNDICPVCFWEDDGQDDFGAECIRGGPNHGLSLMQARLNYREMGACEERVLPFVRLPLPEEW